MSWDISDAVELLAKREAEDRVGPCPACGARAVVDMINTWMIGHDPSFIPGQVRCSARCWREEPQRYIDAVKGRR